MRKLSNRCQKILSLSEAEVLFQPHIDDLIKCVETGWQQWKEFEADNAAYRLPLDDRARASFVYCHIVHDAKRRFNATHGVEIIEEPGYPVFFKFEDRALLRFKKLSRRYEPSNYPTRRQRDLRNQQLDLPGMPPALTYVSLGYCLDGACESILHVAMACWRNDYLQWAFQLGQPMEELLPNFSIPSAPAKKARVRARATQEKKHG